MWTAERKLEAALRAPLVRMYVRADTRIIERPGWYQVVTPSARTYLNEVVLSQLDDDDADRVIDETVATYRAHGVRMRWSVNPQTRPADLGERLRRRGFEAVPFRAMGIDTGVSLAANAERLSVADVEAADVHGFVRTMLRGWSLPEGEVEEESRLHAAVLAHVPRMVHFFGAKVDGEWAGTAALGLRDGYGYLLGGQVLASARGRGVYRGLLAARVACLHARGLQYAVTHAHEATSAPILGHLGFETLYKGTSWCLAP